MDRSVRRPSASSSSPSIAAAAVVDDIDIDVARMVRSTSPSIPPIAVSVIVVIDDDVLDERVEGDGGKVDDGHQ